MVNVKEIENILNPYLEQNGFKLYEIGFVREFGMNILRVLVSKKGGINIDELAMINEYLSEKLDNIDIPYDEYMLEVSSPGAEMPLRSPEEVLEHVGSYININKKLFIRNYLIANPSHSLCCSILYISLCNNIKSVALKSLVIIRYSVCYNNICCGVFFGNQAAIPVIINHQTAADLHTALDFSGCGREDIFLRNLRCIR